MKNINCFLIAQEKNMVKETNENNFDNDIKDGYSVVD